MPLTQITSGGIQDGTITNDDISASATIDATKITGLDKISEGNTEAEVVDTGSNGHFKVTTEGTERLRVDSSGRCGIGTSSPGVKTHIYDASNVGLKVESGGANYTEFNLTNTSASYTIGIRPDVSNALVIRDANATANRVAIDTSGRVGIGVTPSERFHVSGGNSRFEGNYVSFNNNGYIRTDATNELRLQMGSSGTVFANASNIEVGRWDSSGRFLLGTSTAQGTSIFQAVGNSAASTDPGDIRIIRGLGVSSIGGNVGAGLGYIKFGALENTICATIEAQSDGTWSSTSDTPGRLTFSTTADGASSPTERLRIANNGQLSAVVPGNSTLYPGFMARAWVVYDAAGTVSASGNVSSVTKVSTGNWTINFTNAMPDGNYVSVGCNNGLLGGYNFVSASGSNFGSGQRTTTACSVATVDRAGSGIDTTANYWTFFR